MYYSDCYNVSDGFDRGTHFHISAKYSTLFTPKFLEGLDEIKLTSWAL